MTDDRSLERAARSWIEVGPTKAPDRAVVAALAAIEMTTQERDMLPWRFPRMTITARIATLAAIGAITLTGVAVLGGAGLPGLTSVATPSPSASADATVPPSPTEAPGSTAIKGVTPGDGVEAPGTIIFGIETGDGPALLSIRPDGTGLRQITPGGTCCAVLGSPTDEPAFQSTVLFVLDRDDTNTGAEPRWLAGKPAFAPVGDAGFSEAWNTDHLWSAGLLNGVQLFPGASTGLDFAFEGVSASNPTLDGIYLSVANGGGMAIGEFVRMTGRPDGARDIPIAFSPDGSSLLFLRDAGIDSQMGRLGDLYVIDRGSFPRSGSGAYRPGEMRRLSPDGTLVLVSDAFGAGASWAPDGTRVAFTAFPRLRDTYDPSARVFVADASTGVAEPITAASPYMTSARWSPDGARIAYDVSEGGGPARNVWVVRPDGTDARRLVSFAGGSCCSVWSPDSTHLLAQGSDGTGDGLFIIAADGSGHSRLTTVDSAYDLRFVSWGGWPTTP